MKESDHDKFKRLAEARVRKLAQQLRLVGNLSDKSNYKYTDEQVEEIFNFVESAVFDCKERFLNPDNATTFSLSE